MTFNMAANAPVGIQPSSSPHSVNEPPPGLEPAKMHTTPFPDFQITGNASLKAYLEEQAQANCSNNNNKKKSEWLASIPSGRAQLHMSREPTGSNVLSTAAVIIPDLQFLGLPREIRDKHIFGSGIRLDFCQYITKSGLYCAPNGCCMFEEDGEA